MKTKTTKTTKVEQDSFKVSGEELLKKIKELIREGNVREISIENKKGKVIMVLPLTVGIIGAALLPPLAAVGAIAALLTECTLRVKRNK
jgi:predicted regulator of Ras-like GTPase activity (Roadblock/LC7/MglB family)